MSAAGENSTRSLDRRRPPRLSLQEWSTPQHTKQYRPIVLADRKLSLDCNNPSVAPKMSVPRSPVHQPPIAPEVRPARYSTSEEDTWIPGAPLTSYSSLLDTMRLGGGSEADSSQSGKSDHSEPIFKRPRPGRRHHHHSQPLDETRVNSDIVPLPLSAHVEKSYQLNSQTLQRAEAWDIEDEDTIRPHPHSSTVNHLSETFVTSRLSRHYLHNPTSTTLAPPTSPLHTVDMSRINCPSWSPDHVSLSCSPDPMRTDTPPLPGRNKTVSTPFGMGLKSKDMPPPHTSSSLRKVETWLNHQQSLPAAEERDPATPPPPPQEPIRETHSPSTRRPSAAEGPRPLDSPSASKMRIRAKSNPDLKLSSTVLTKTLSPIMEGSFAMNREHANGGTYFRDNRLDLSSHTVGSPLHSTSVTPDPWDEHEERGHQHTNEANLKKGAESLAMSFGLKLKKKLTKRVKSIGDTGSTSPSDPKRISSITPIRSSSSTGNLTKLGESGRRAQSLEQLDDNSGSKGAGGVVGIGEEGIPKGTPKSTPKLGRHSLGEKIHSESDLQNAGMTPLKKNVDPTDALFEEVELGSLEGCQQIIDSHMVPNLNVVNDDGIMPVDLAAMLGHTEVVKLLQSKGAKDSPKFCRDPFVRFSHITSQLMEYERKVESVKMDMLTQSGGSLKELQQKLKLCESKASLFAKMKANYEQAEKPGSPRDITLEVSSNSSLLVKFSEPVDPNGAPVTRYKVEWCTSHAFVSVVGEFVVSDLRSMEYIIPDLKKGERYFVRVSAYNMKGFGRPQLAQPPSAVPTCWHDVDGTSPRYDGTTNIIQTIAAQLSIMLSTSPPISPPPSSNETSTSSLSNSGKTAMKKTKSKLFGSSVKFHKTMKASGVYLGSLVYCDSDKVLVTVDDRIPVVQISDSPSSAIGGDFVWLSKVACTWEHVRGMCEISDDYTSSPAIQFRNKLLHGMLDMQSAIGLQNLGLLYPIPYKDHQGSILLLTVQCVQDYGNPVASSLKWGNLFRLLKKHSQTTITADVFSLPEQVILDAQEIIAYHVNSTKPLSRGLYLGYMKARSYVGSMKVICSREFPNVLPHIKLRDNPNISMEEWKWLTQLKSGEQIIPTSSGSSAHQSLQKVLLPNAEVFLQNLGISKADAEAHGIYCREVIELNEDVSVLLLMPPPEHVCTPPGSVDQFEGMADFTALPITSFEIMQLFTYQQAFMSKFSMVSSRLDLELLESQQRIREAFSKEEVSVAKQQNQQLQDFQERTDQVWRRMRWIEDALQNGRDASGSSVVSLKKLKDTIKSQNGTVRRVLTLGATSGYLRVYPAYETGLIKGTNVKLYITQMTTTTEVIKLVVQQLERARKEKGLPGKPVTSDDLTDFFIVASGMDHREFVLENDFHPLQLQSQMPKLHLFVKRKSDEQRYCEEATNV
ncbi:hypothetical protein EMCRGX_G027615 [Ephydatia muelleri]